MIAEPVFEYRTSSMDVLISYRDRIGLDAWNSIENKVYAALLALRPGNYYNIATQVAEKDQELFVKICCLFILEQPVGCEHPIGFSDGHTVKRI